MNDWRPSPAWTRSGSGANPRENVAGKEGTEEFAGPKNRKKHILVDTSTGTFASTFSAFPRVRLRGNITRLSPPRVRETLRVMALHLSRVWRRNGDGGRILAMISPPSLRAACTRSQMSRQRILSRSPAAHPLLWRSSARCPAAAAAAGEICAAEVRPTSPSSAWESSSSPEPAQGKRRVGNKTPNGANFRPGLKGQPSVLCSPPTWFSARASLAM